MRRMIGVVLMVVVQLVAPTLHAMMDGAKGFVLMGHRGVEPRTSRLSRVKSAYENQR